MSSNKFSIGFLWKEENCRKSLNWKLFNMRKWLLQCWKAVSKMENKWLEKQCEMLRAQGGLCWIPIEHSEYHIAGERERSEHCGRVSKQSCTPIHKKEKECYISWSLTSKSLPTCFWDTDVSWKGLQSPCEEPVCVYEWACMYIHTYSKTHFIEK